MRNISIPKLTAVELGYNFGTKAPHRPSQLRGLARAARLHLYCACSIVQLAQKSKPILSHCDSPNIILPQLHLSQLKLLSGLSRVGQALGQVSCVSV